MTSEQIRQHIDRYFVAVHGKGYVYRAPETFQNVLECWMLAVGADQGEVAEECITQIEQHFGGK